MIGKVLLHYRIVERIGAGGMGVVYKAEDTKLGRDVALKFLPDFIANDEETLLRFRREARTASSLNHSHICTIHSIDEFEGRPFIVMEFLEGRSLREVIDGKPMAIERVVELALQIVDALQAAHIKNIVHRDIKPGNIFICSGDHIKLLDFGLAKSAADSLADGVETSAPTRAADLTRPGTMLGTFDYMSPEQARGEQLDGRSDLFSFGVVLYEMVTGRPAFRQHTAPLIFEAILNKSPQPPIELNSEVSPELEQIIMKLLEKDRTLRYQTAADVRADLARLKRDRESAIQTRAVPRRPVPRSSRRRLVPGILLGIAVAAGLYAAFRFRSASAPTSSRMSFSQLTNEAGPELFPSLSPDGKSVIYTSPAAGNWDIYFQRVGGKTTVNLTKDSAADDTQPAFSPDGELIAFRSERDGGGIFVMGATGESARRVSSFGFNPAWSPDGKEILVAEESVTDSPSVRQVDTSALYSIDVATGRRREITKGDAVQPHWSPHGNRIAYWASISGQRDIWTIRPDGTAPVRVTNDAALDWNPLWSPDGKYLYFSSDRGGNNNLWRVPIDEQSGKALGTLEPVTTGGGLGQRFHPSIAANAKRITYVEETITENIQRASLDPISGKIAGIPTPVTRGFRILGNPDVSPDGEWLAFKSVGPPDDIAVMAIDGTRELRLTNDSAKDRVPRWSPDGKRVAFYSNRSGNYELYTIRSDGSDLQQITNDAAFDSTHPVWSPDGKHLAGNHVVKGSFIVDLNDAGSRNAAVALPPFDVPGEVFDVWSWSPDGKTLAGTRVTAASGEPRGIAVYSLDSRRYTRLTDFGDSPQWLNDNRRVVFLSAGKVHLLDTASDKAQVLFSLAPSEINSVALSRDNRTMYVTARSLEADVWLIAVE